MLIEGLWIKDTPHTQNLFMTSFEPPESLTDQRREYMCRKGHSGEVPFAGKLLSHVHGEERCPLKRSEASLGA